MSDFYEQMRMIKVIAYNKYLHTWQKRVLVRELFADNRMAETALQTYLDEIAAANQPIVDTSLAGTRVRDLPK